MAFSAETWREADTHFSALLEHPESSWQERVEALSLSSEVRECLERLIAATGGQGPLDQSIEIGTEQYELPVDQLTGQIFGPWRLGKEIGRGGMAVVYEARRLKVDFDQLAAVKLLPRGSTGQDQFRREQILLARLEHPFIASFLDAGVGDDGTPWIAMERVIGAPLEQVTEGWDEKSIVALMRRVIEAVAFAHRHLIIHRDLKPGNVLVDEGGRPRLLDFGIAKLLSTEAMERGTRVLTPEYAAPEQFNGQAVSTATDVYGLGAILYRLLTGEAPRQRNGQDVSDLRAIEDADLRAIVEKALRDDPTRRYETAEALNADLGRWQRMEPVLARPDSRRYRLERWVIRHRSAAIGALLVLFALVLGSVAVAWQSHQTAKQARMVAAQNNVLEDLLAAPRRTAMGRQVAMADVLEEAIDSINAHMPEPTRERSMLTSNIGLTLENLGRPESALALWRYAEADVEQVLPVDYRRLTTVRLGIARNLIATGNFAVAQAVLDALHSMAIDHLEPHDELQALIAVQRYRAVSQQRGVQASDPLVENVLEAGRSVRWQSDEAQDSFRCGQLNLLIDIGRFDEAVEEAAALRAWMSDTWGPDSGRALCAYEGAVVALSRSGRPAEAEQLAKEAVSRASEWLGDRDRVTFSLRHSQASIVQELGRNDEAIALHRAQIERMDRVEGLSHAERALSYQGLAVALLESGQYAEAESIKRRILSDLREEGLGETPQSLIVQANIAELLLFDGRPEEALSEIEPAHARLEATLGGEHPVTVFSRSVRGGVRVALGQSLDALADLEQAPAQLEAAFGVDVNVMNSRVWKAQALLDLERGDEAVPLIQAAYDWHTEHKGAEHPRTVVVGSLLGSLSESDDG